jgi:hypothetical protein
LYLFVDPSLARRWIWRGVVGGKRCNLAPGSVALVPLVETRAEAIRLKAMARKGLDPRVERRREQRVVLLDPDTGLAPAGVPTLDHVLDEELAVLWSQLEPEDVMVLYPRHTNRTGRPWIPEKKHQFESALRLPAGSAAAVRSERIPRDVTLFYAARPA